jgi:glycosyltransferase involved in cell wall biosynthesis
MCSGIGETWGLSVNEAMNFGLPVIVSSTCGSSYDLVDHGRNGFVFDEGDIATLNKLIFTLIEDEKLRFEMSEIAKHKINTYSHSLTCENIIANLKMACV